MSLILSACYELARKEPNFFHCTFLSVAEFALKQKYTCGIKMCQVKMGVLSKLL